MTESSLSHGLKNADPIEVLSHGLLRGDTSESNSRRAILKTTLPIPDGTIDVWDRSHIFYAYYPGTVGISDFYPEDNAEDISRVTTLQWPQSNAPYTIAFGISSPPSIVSVSNVPVYSPGKLMRGTRYYWSINGATPISFVTEDKFDWAYYRRFKLMQSLRRRRRRRRRR